MNCFQDLSQLLIDDIDNCCFITSLLFHGRITNFFHWKLMNYPSVTQTSLASNPQSLYSTVFHYHQISIELPNHLVKAYVTLYYNDIAISQWGMKSMYSGISFLVSLTIATSEIWRNADFSDFSATFSLMRVGRTNRGKISEMQNVEYSECLVACAYHLNCRSVNYNQEKKKCELVDKNVNINRISANKGWLAIGTDIDVDQVKYLL